MDQKAEDAPSVEKGNVVTVPVARDLRLSVLLSTGEAFLEQKRYGVARQLFFESLAKKPWSLRGLAGLGRLYNETNKPEEALGFLTKLLVYRPNWTKGLSNCANAFSQLDDFTAAEKWYLRSLATEPDNRSMSLALGVTQMRLGNWTAGLARYETRESVVSLHKAIGSGKVWDGRTDISGMRFLIVGEQGFGDHIQFMRYSKLLKGLGAQIVFFTRPELKELASWVPWIDETVVDREKVAFDVAAMSMSLPYLFGTTPNSVPVREPYIQVPDRTGPARTKHEKETKRILLAWKGNSNNSRDPVRSAPAALVADLIHRFPGIDFFALPFDLPLADGARNIKLSPICELDASFADLARAMDQIDLVVTVDTSLAHLAAALGKPTCILIGKQPDWRWLASGEDSIWYETARLFRARNNWEDVFDRVSELLRNSPSRRSPLDLNAKG